MAVGVRHHDTRPSLQLHLRPNMQIQTQFLSSQFLPNFRKCRISKKDGRDRRESRDGREIKDRGTAGFGIGGTERGQMEEKGQRGMRKREERQERRHRQERWERQGRPERQVTGRGQGN